MPEEKSVDTMAMELTEKSITRLLSVVREGKSEEVSLVEDELSDEVYLDLIRQFFERLGLPIPQSILNGEASYIEVEHTMVGKAVKISASYTPTASTHYALSAKTA